MPPFPPPIARTHTRATPKSCPTTLTGTLDDQVELDACEGERALDLEAQGAAGVLRARQDEGVRHGCVCAR